MGLCDAEEQGREAYEKAQEKILYDKALQKDKNNMTYLNRTFPYITEEHLYDSLRALYPELNELFLVNLDERDSNNIPLVKTKNFRPIHISHSRTVYRTGQVECHVDMTLKMIVAVIENGTVYIKSTRMSNGYYNKRR